MACLGRVILQSGERIDLPDLKAIDSYTMGDFKYLIESFIGNQTPYILKGFEVVNPDSVIGLTSLSIRIAESVVYCPTAGSSPFFFGLEIGNPIAADITPTLQGVSGTILNYIYLVLSTSDGVPDIRSFWNKLLNGGAGGEFSQLVNTETYVTVEIGVSTAGFPDGTIPICQVLLNANQIVSIEDCRNLMFRLGTGGLTPDIYNDFDFPSLPAIGYERTETPITINGANKALIKTPFQGADKNIKSLKEWMDIVMTKLKELGGTQFWYQTTTSASTTNIFNDTLGSIFKSKGTYTHSLSVPGRITWSEDIKLSSLLDPRTYIFTGPTTKDLLNEEILYASLIRNATINLNGLFFDWITSANYVNGPVGSFTNLVVGDWIKPANGSDNLYVRIEDFNDDSDLSGSYGCAPANAKSVLIISIIGDHTTTYPGLTQTTIGVYSKGRYDAGDLLIGDRNNDPNILAAGGNFCWFVYRSDTIENITSIVSTTLTTNITPISITSARVVSAAHGLLSGDSVTVKSTSTYAGTYVIEYEDANTFVIYLDTTGLGPEVGTEMYYAMVTTRIRYNAAGTGIIEESADHNFEDEDKVILFGTVGFDGTYVNKNRTSTTFTIPIPNAIASDMTGVGTATQCNLNVRMESGIERLVQGQVKEIGETEAENIMLYTGQPDIETTTPIYLTPTPNEYLDGMSNYGDINKTDDLTKRAARLTSMVADKAQDKTIKKDVNDLYTVTNTINAGNQDVTFQGLLGTPVLYVDVPSTYNGVVVYYGTEITLTNTLSLAADTAAYFVIDRNTIPTLAIANVIGTAQTAGNRLTPGLIITCPISQVPVDENVFIFAIRHSTNTVWLWDDTECVSGVTNYATYSYVPYTGARTNVDLGINNLTTLGTITSGLEAIEVYNNTGSPIAADTVIKVAGDYPTNSIPEVAPISSSGDIPIGVVMAPLSSGSVGVAIKRARQLTTLDTSGGSVNVGDPVYSTSTGTLSLVSSNITVGQVLTKAANGVVYFNIGGNGGGGGVLRIKSVNGVGYTILDTDGYNYFDITATATLVLPAPGNNVGRLIYIKNIGTGPSVITISRNNANDTIDGVKQDLTLTLVNQLVGLLFTAAGTIEVVVQSLNDDILNTAISYVVLDGDRYDYIDVTATCTITLPAPANNIGRKLIIKNIGAAGSGTIVTIARNNVNDTIDGTKANLTLSLENQSVELVFTAANTIELISSASKSSFGIKSVNGAGYTVLDGDGYDYFEATAACTIVLPKPADNIGRKISIKNVSAGTILLQRNNGADTIDGTAANFSLYTQYQSIDLLFTVANTIRIVGGVLLNATYSA